VSPYSSRTFPLKQRLPARLEPTIERRLLGYAAAAGATALLTMAQPAEGKIVFTATHETIFPNTTVEIDINNDGIPDFRIAASSDFGVNSQTQHAYGNVKALGLLPSNGMVRYYFPFVAALKAGSVVGPTTTTGFINSGFMAHCATSRDGGSSRFSNTGRWFGQTNKFLGLKFSVNGQIHYGWARLSSKQGPKPCELTLVLTGYAYETVPNKTIVTGKTKGPDTASVQPSTLGRLALGAAELSPWRREEEAGA
jgi:hypothetical protein